MSSYFDFFCENIQKTNTEAIKGTCKAMCPQDEVSMREREDLVHVLEVWGPVRKFVKSYSRSAADSNMAQPHLLRPYSVLKETVQYLILDVTKRIDVSAPCVYDFVNDRLRAVRQDMTIQRLPLEQCAKLLEPMIRFYVLYGYKLCNLPIKDYDPVLNKKYLLECMKLYLTCTMDTDSNDVSQLLSNVDLNYKLKSDRVLVESLYILCNLDNREPLVRYLSLLPKDLKCNPKLQLAFKIALANVKGDFISVCRLMEQLCPLNYCAVCIYLPILQRRALYVLSHAYNSKNLTVPAAAVRQWLRFDSDADVIAACTHYGLSAEAGSVSFCRTAFKQDVAVFQPGKQLLTDKNYDFSVDHVYTYTSRVNLKSSTAKNNRDYTI